MSLHDFMQGKPVDIPPKVMTFMFVAVTGWSIEYIESISQDKFRELSPMIQIVFSRNCAKLM